MRELSYINYIIAVLFAACFSYQALYMIVAWTRKQKKFQAKKQHKYAAIISARNEAQVIPQLIESLRWQKYPKELLDIFVVADNCTDDTAHVARELGAYVYERFSKEKVGKGYALDYLFGKIFEEHGDRGYEAFLVFDADNIVDENYVTEMNKVFDNGYCAVTSYRNSKNYGDNWLSSGYSLWFLKEAKYLNNPRMTLSTSCAISGTGFLVSADIIKRNGGWKYFTLTEDIEFTFDRIAEGDKIGYAEDAIIYDEQPTKLGQSITQRSRWIKGFMQVFGKYYRQMGKKIVIDGSFSAFDMVMNSLPSYFLTLASVLLNTVMFVFGIIAKQDMNILIYSCAATVANAYFFLAVLGGITAFTERKRINATNKQMVLSVLTFPFFVGTYLFAVLVALFTDVKWKPISHTAAASAAEMKKLTKNK